MHRPYPHVALCAALLASAAGAQTMTNQHVSSAGVQGNFSAIDQPSISDDDRYVAFASQAGNLAPGDAGTGRDIFVHDNVTGSTVLISHTPAGTASNGDDARPWLSSNGRFVVFQSNATDIIPGVTGNQIYRYDRDTDADGVMDEPGATAFALASVATGGAVGNGPSRCYANSISDDGDVVAFDSDATNLVAGDTNANTDCFVHVFSSGSTSRISVTSAGVQCTGNCERAAVSGNGLFVAFNSYASDLVGAQDVNVLSDVFRHTRSTGATSLVSVTGAGVSGDGGSIWPAISDDGDRIAFQSYATNLVAGDTNGTEDVFVHTISSGTTVRASVSSAGAQAAGGASQAFISGDGTTASFSSASADLVPGDTNGFADVFVRVLATGTTARASRAVDGTQGSAQSIESSTNDDGTLVAFLSAAPNLVPVDVNGFIDVLMRGQPLLGPAGVGATGMGIDADPVTFSVNGPVDPHTEGIRYARGTPPTPQVPVLPGDPMGHCMRTGAVAQASGLPTPLFGDVFDYDAAGIPSEAVMFSSPPFAPPPPGPPPSPPDGTNNQILEAMGLGLMSGAALPPGFWTTSPPFAPGRDNIDAFSFGEDYFPPVVARAFSPGFPLPPLGPMGTISVVASPWGARVSLYSEPIVAADAPGISFRFSTDPWAIGTFGTAVSIESGGIDAGFGCGPWTSAGDAAGDVFGTPTLMRIALATIGGGINALVHDNPTLALAPAPPPMMPAEDDLDALECVGENTIPWFGGVLARPGNLHARVMHVGPPGPPPPGISAHDVMNDAPVFFSVTRNSPGAAFSGVRSQFVIDGGAAADVFVSAKGPGMPPGVATNLLFLDESEIGLLAIDMSPGGTSAADLTDDLDALILRVCPEYRPLVSLAIDEIMGVAPPFVLGGLAPLMAYGFGDAYTGGGMTISVVKYLEGTGRPVPPGCIQVGFSVSTDSIGMEYTAVDWEAGPVFPPGGASTAAGDIFYAEPDGSGVGSNWLWYEEVDLGLDAGSWVCGASSSLADLSDNLDALDSILEPGMGTGTAFCFGDGSGAACPCGNTSPAGQGRGCLHSLGTGAKLASSGYPSVALDTLKLQVSGTPPTASGIFFQGTTPIAGGAGIVFGDGLRCVGGAVMRVTTVIAAGGAASFGYGNPGDPAISMAGMIPAAGGTRHYQYWYRNAAAFCTPSTFNLSNGLSVAWTP